MGCLKVLFKVFYKSKRHYIWCGPGARVVSRFNLTGQVDRALQCRNVHEAIRISDCLSI